MAKVTGGLLSLGATGTIGESITFGSWKGVKYARQRVIPANPRSTGQVNNRNLFTNGGNIYKLAGSLLRAPWDRAAVGQPKTGRNIFQGSFNKNLQAQTDLSLMEFSPGAKGGLPADAVVATPAQTSIALAFTNPAPPDGWTLQSAVAALIKDGDPKTLTDFTTVEAEDDSTQNSVTLPGLVASTQYAVGAWLRWAKPDGSIAYGASITQLVSTTA